MKLLTHLIHIHYQLIHLIDFLRNGNCRLGSVAHIQCHFIDSIGSLGNVSADFLVVTDCSSTAAAIVVTAESTSRMIL